MRAWLLALAILVVPAAGWAGTASHGCSYTGGVAGTTGTAVGTGATRMTLSADERWCYRYVNADATTTIIGPLRASAPSVTIWFDPDLYQAGVASTARMVPFYCPAGAAVDTTSLATIKRSCPSVGAANGTASFDGTEGASTVQNQSWRYPGGTFYFEINAVCEAGDTCQIAVLAEGEGSN